MLCGQGICRDAFLYIYPPFSPNSACHEAPGSFNHRNRLFMSWCLACCGGIVDVEMHAGLNQVAWSSRSLHGTVPLAWTELEHDSVSSFPSSGSEIKIPEAYPHSAPRHRHLGNAIQMKKTAADRAADSWRGELLQPRLDHCRGACPASLKQPSRCPITSPPRRK